MGPPDARYRQGLTSRSKNAEEEQQGFVSHPPLRGQGPGVAKKGKSAAIPAIFLLAEILNLPRSVMEMLCMYVCMYV